jgi:hypothetical protein
MRVSGGVACDVNVPLCRLEHDGNKRPDDSKAMFESGSRWDQISKKCLGEIRQIGAFAYFAASISCPGIGLVIRSQTR